MVKMIISVEKSKDGSRTYATDSAGNPMFGRTSDITAKLAANHYANVIEQLQTKTTNPQGELVDLPVEEQRKLWIITAVFPNRAAAIAVASEDQVFALETKAYAQSQVEQLALNYKLDAKALAASI